jgi:hypothetical protein
MKFRELERQVPPGGVFRTGWLLAGQSSPANVRRQLDRWVKNGRIIRLRREVYAIADAHGNPVSHPFTAANVMKKGSYVSLQSALAHYGMIPEYVPVTTSVTTGRPEELETPIGRFQYRHVSQRLFYGFSDVEIRPDQRVLLADPEKALVDLLYLSPRSDNKSFLRELRLQPADLSRDSLLKTAERSGSDKVLRAVRNLLTLWKEKEAE